MKALTFALAASCLLSAQAPPPAPPPVPLAVMSFNIRYGTAGDGENRWEARRDLLFDVVREQAADVVGLQEALDFQVDQILAAVPRYAVVGVGRDDGRRAGEYAAILFDKDRLRVAESGTFWFSDTPAVPASKSWGNNVTRICTWARFVDRDGRAFWVFNVHLDHESQPSREKSAALLRDRIASRCGKDESACGPASERSETSRARGGGVPRAGEEAIVTGDFNADESNPVLEIMRQAGFVDTFRVLHPDEKKVGTFTAFKAGAEDGDKIDYVMVRLRPDTTGTNATNVLSAGVVRTSRNGRYPSDHFPVTATLVLR